MRTVRLTLLCCFLFVNSSENYSLSRSSYKPNQLGEGNGTNPLVFKDNEILLTDNVCDDESDFPQFFTKEQLRNGAVIVCVLVGIYCFTTLAIVCDNFFLPCVGRFCILFNISEDVAGATFMSIATTAPEFFVNLVATFVTHSDIGIGTVVGSNMYNTLAVAALGSLAASSPVHLNWWPVTRDSVLYTCTISILVAVTWNGEIYWYKTLFMFSALVVYFTILFNNKRIYKFVCKIFRINRDKVETEKKDVNKRDSCVENKIYKDDMTQTKDVDESKKFQRFRKLFVVPDKSLVHKLWFFYSWPIKAFLYVTLPNPKRKSNLFILTFMMCIIIIGLNSYVISWMLTLIGATAGIPDSVLGLTFLAFGGGLPETISIVILSMKGEGSIGVSNALGANTINILMSLGVPWMIKLLITGFDGNYHIEIISGTLSYTIMGLLLVISVLYFTLLFNRFNLSRASGLVLSAAYVVLLASAVVVEVMFIHPEEC